MRRFILIALIGLLSWPVSYASAEPMDEVVRTLIQEASEESLENVEDTLVKLGPTAVHSLARLLASEDNALRMAAVRVLGKMDKIAREVLFQALSDEHWRVRAGAAVALGSHASDVVVNQLILATKDKHQAVRSAAVRSLGRIGNTKATESIVRALQDSNQLVRKNAAKALGIMKDAQAALPLISVLQDEDAVQREVIAALGQIGQPALSPLAVIVADDGVDSGLRRFAAEALVKVAYKMGERGQSALLEKSAPSLMVGLRAENGALRKASADALVMIGQPAFGVVGEALFTDKNSAVRAEAASILGRSGAAKSWYAEAVDLLIVALDDQDESVRLMVQESLVRIHVIGLGQLLKALNDNNTLRRQGVSSILGKLRHRGAIDPLEIRLAIEPDQAVQQAIRSSLDTLRATSRTRVSPPR